MNRRAFLAGLLASSALARAPARIPMVSPAPVYLACSPSLGELLLANAQEAAVYVQRSSLRDFIERVDDVLVPLPPGQYADFLDALELVEGRLGTIKGFEFIS